jgi:hypothetical protein
MILGTWSCRLFAQIFYTAKVVPSTPERREAVQLRNTFYAQDVPERVMQHMQVSEHATRIIRPLAASIRGHHTALLDLRTSPRGLHALHATAHVFGRA